MSRRGVFMAAVLALAIGAVATARQATFRSGVSLVRVNVLVTDRGKPVHDLTGQDFEIFDNGVRQQIESMSAAMDPVDVLFAFDRSGSVRGETLTRLKEASRAVLDELDAEDRSALLTFNQGFRMAAGMTGDRGVARQAIESIEAAGSTSLLDALYAGLTLSENGARRTMILLFTDGWDNSSWLPKREVLEAAQTSEAVAYAVAVRSDGRATFGPPGPDEQLLGELAGATGGRVLFADNSDRLKPAFLTLLQEMRSRYLLTYSPRGSDAAGWHKLSVRLKHRNGRVTARAGYRVNSG